MRVRIAPVAGTNTDGVQLVRALVRGQRDRRTVAGRVACGIDHVRLAEQTRRLAARNVDLPHLASGAADEAAVGDQRTAVVDPRDRVPVPLRIGLVRERTHRGRSPGP